MNKVFCYWILVAVFLVSPEAHSFDTQNEPLSSPVKVTSLEYAMTGRWNQGPVFASATSGNYLYFGSAGTLRVVEVTKDSSGKAYAWDEVSALATEGVIRDMLIHGEYLYIADGSGWLRIVNIKEPSLPQHSGKIFLNSEIKSVNYENETIYLAAGWKGIHIVDVADKMNPQFKSSADSVGYVLDVVVKDSIALVASGVKGMQVVDVSNDLAPKKIASHEVSGSAAGIDYDGRYAYVVNMDDVEPSLSIFDLSDKENPTRIAAEPLKYGAERVRVEGDLVYVAGVANDAGLIVVDVTNPKKPLKLGSWWDSTCSESVSIDNGIAYLAHGDQGLEIFDLTDPNQLAVTKHFSAAGHVRGVDVQEKLAFLANGYRGLKVVDLSDSNNAKTVSELKTYRALDVEVVGKFAHIADDWAGYKLVDISNPKEPKEIAKLNTPGYAEDLFVAKDLVFIADGDGGLRILDISDPLLPKEIASVEVDGYAYEVTVQGRYAYLAAGKSGLLKIDISEPSKPKVVSTFKPDNKKFEARGVALQGNYALLAAGYTGMSIIDTSDSENLVQVGHFKTKKRANHISVDDDKAYVIDSNMVKVINISKPDTPRLIEEHVLPASAAKVHSSGSKILVAGMESGLLIFEH